MPGEGGELAAKLGRELRDGAELRLEPVDLVGSALDPVEAKRECLEAFGDRPIVVGAEL